MGDLRGRVVGRYAVEARLGAGAMGEVYRARDERLGRVVAIKRLVPGLASDDAYRERLLHEARNAARLNHPSISGMYDVVEDADDLYLVMEYVEGETLRERLQDGPLDIDVVVPLVVQCAEAVAAAHRDDLVHRDLKPGNIMVTPDGRVKVLDFGIAHTVPDAEAHTASDTEPPRDGIIGTPGYMAPEVLRGDAVDGRADIFSLGVVYYEMLTGRHPFRGRTWADTVDRVLHAAPPSPVRLNPEVSPGLERIVAKMLEKDPEARYATADDLVVDLRALPSRRGSGARAPAGFAGVEDEPAPAGLVALRRWLRPVSRRPLVATGSVVAVLLSVAVGLLMIGASSATVPLGSGVLLVGVDNRTDDPRLDAIDEVLRDQLDQSGYFRLASREQVGEVLARMRLDGELENVTMTPRVGREIAWREGLPLVVAGTLTRLGGRFQLSLRLERPGEDPTVVDRAWVESFAAPDEEGLYDAVDRASDWARRMLGEAAGDLARLDVPARKATSASWQALKLYRRHFQLRDEGNVEEAILLLERAVEIDPEFAKAYARLGDLYGSRDLAKAFGYWETALRLADRLRLTDKERLSIEAQYANDSGDARKALESYTLLILNYPYEYTAYFGRAVNLSKLGRVEEALSLLEETLQRWPDGPYAPYTLAEMVIQNLTAGRYAAAGARLAELRRLRAGSPSWQAQGFYLEGASRLLRGDVVGARNSFSRLAESEIPRWRSLGYSVVASMLGEAGEYGRALEVLAEGIGHDTDRGSLDYSKSDKYLAKAYLHFRRGEVERCREASEQAIELSQDPHRVLRAGTLLARAGFLDEARRLIDRLPRVEAPVYVRARERIAGEVLLESGDVDGALRAFRRADEVEAPTVEREYLGRALRAAGDATAALGEYRDTTRWTAGLVVGDPVWRAWPGFRADVMFEQAELAVAVGDRDTAAELLGAYLGLRGAGDEDIPEIEQARRMLDELSGQPTREAASLEGVAVSRQPERRGG